MERACQRSGCNTVLLRQESKNKATECPPVSTRFTVTLYRISNRSKKFDTMSYIFSQSSGYEADGGYFDQSYNDWAIVNFFRFKMKSFI